METLKDQFQNMHLLGREERLNLQRELRLRRPEFLERFLPPHWWWRCEAKVLIVCDGGLNFGTNDFGLSEFLTTFNQLESQSPVDYKVTLAHRGTVINSTNPVVVDHISSFNFETSVDLDDFDQIWLFAISSFGSLTTNEINAIESYMNGGGGLFATGDHGALGRAMCGNIPRVKDMRLWEDTPPGPNNEVSMGGRRRNDTNRPGPGQSASLYFDNQSDDIPQTIAVRTFGTGMPHPLLSISPSIRASGIIDIMPDHPHEGECAPETTFTVNGQTIPTQVIATSFVLGGSTTFGGAGKTQTDPHCFPSIAVWDGRPANVGRIVVDSTWHHFVNINLRGNSSSLDLGLMSGLTNSDFNVVRQYYMNIATWMTRRKFMICLYERLIVDLLADSQLIEANLNNPNQPLDDIPLADLNSIGALAEEVLSTKYSPVFARTFLLDVASMSNSTIGQMLDPWTPKMKEEEEEGEGSEGYYSEWINLDLILWTSVGAGFIALRDDEQIGTDQCSEKDLSRIFDVVGRGMKFGFQRAMNDLKSNYNRFLKKVK